MLSSHLSYPMPPFLYPFFSTHSLSFPISIFLFPSILSRFPATTFPAIPCPSHGLFFPLTPIYVLRGVDETLEASKEEEEALYHQNLQHSSTATPEPSV